MGGGSILHTYRQVGRPVSNNRLFINAIFWILRTVVPWRDLHQIMEIGKMLTFVFVAGGIKRFGKIYLKFFIIEPDYGG